MQVPQSTGYYADTTHGSKYGGDNERHFVAIKIESQCLVYMYTKLD